MATAVARTSVGNTSEASVLTTGFPPSPKKTAHVRAANIGALPWAWNAATPLAIPASMKRVPVRRRPHRSCRRPATT